MFQCSVLMSLNLYQKIRKYHNRKCITSRMFHFFVYRLSSSNFARIEIAHVKESRAFVHNTKIKWASRAGRNLFYHPHRIRHVRPSDFLRSQNEVSPAKVNRIRFLTHLSMFGWLSLFISWTSLSIFGLFAASWFILSTITWLVTLWVTWKNEANTEVSNILRYAVTLLLTLDHTTGAYVTVPILCVTNFAKVTRTLFLQYYVILRYSIKSLLTSLVQNSGFIFRIIFAIKI